jgi:competence protein ComEA
MASTFLARSSRLVFLCFSVFFCGLVPSAAQQLPDAPGKDAVVRVCGTCHEPQRSASVRLTREGWQDVIAKMVSLGAKGTDQELKQILDYLSEHFKGEAAKPLNLNSATAIELESVAGLLRREAAAWIAHRTKNGPCKSLDDFKKIPGVPYKKIEERKDYLICMVLGPAPAK